MRSVVACWAFLLLPLEVTCRARVWEDEVTSSYEELLALTAKQKDTIASLQHEVQQLRHQLEGGCNACSNRFAPAGARSGIEEGDNGGSKGADGGETQPTRVLSGQRDPCRPPANRWRARSITENELEELRNCTELFSEDALGYLTIYAGLVKDLTPLQSLRKIWGDLRLLNDSLSIFENGLKSLSEISGPFAVNSPSATNLSSLRGLRKVGNLRIANNPQLVTLDGLNGLQEVTWGNLDISGNPRLRSLRGLHNLVSVGGMVRINQNDLLENLAGLDSLRFVWGPFHIMENMALKSLHGIGRLELAGRMKVHYNRNMKYLGGPFSCRPAPLIRSLEFLDDKEGRCGDKEEDGNPLEAFPRCVSPVEWESIRSRIRYVERDGAPRSQKDVNMSCVSNDSDLYNSDLDYWLKPKDSPCGPNLITCLWNQPCQLNFTELNIDYNGNVSLPECGTCGSCKDGTEVPHNRTIDPRSLFTTEDYVPGSYTICRCDKDDLGPLMQIDILGPRTRLTLNRCTRGVSCTIRARFDAEAVNNSELWLVPEDQGCVTDAQDRQGTPDKDVVTVPGVPTENGDVVLSAEGLSQNLRPGDYKLCWQPHGERFHAQDIPGVVKLQGPFEKDSPDAQKDDNKLLGIRYDGTAIWELVLRDGEISFEPYDNLQDELELVPAPLNCTDIALREVGIHWLPDHRGSQERFNFRMSDLLPGTTYSKCWRFDNTSQYIHVGSVSIICPPNKVVYGGECRKCPAGRVFDRGSNPPECGLDGQYWTLLGLHCVSLFWVLYLLLVVLRKPIRIQDTYTCSGMLYAATAHPHGFYCYGRKSFPVIFKATRNRRLDNPAQRLRAFPNMVQSVRILTENGETISECWDTSRGYVQLPLLQEFWHRGWPLPSGVLLVLNSAFYIGFLLHQMEDDNLVPMHVLCGAATALGLALILRVLNRLYIRYGRLTELDTRIASYRATLRSKNPKPVACEKGPGRAVALSELFDILEFFKAYIRDRNAYYMDTNILGPLTAPDQLSYAEVAGPMQVKWFVSHYWGNAYQDLCKTLRKHAETMTSCARTTKSNAADLWKDEAYWICFFSNNQYRIDYELGTGWDESSFFLTLQSGYCKGVCLVLDTLAAPLTRAWCIFELLQTLIMEDQTTGCTKTDGFKGLHLCTDGGVLNEGQGSAEVTINLVERICRLDLEKADASSQQDKEMIHMQVEKSLGSFKKMNAKVRHKFDDLLKRAKQQQDSSFCNVYSLLQGALHEDACYAEDLAALGALPGEHHPVKGQEVALELQNSSVQAEGSTRAPGAGMLVALDMKDGCSAIVHPDIAPRAPFAGQLGTAKGTNSVVPWPSGDGISTSQVVQKQI